MSKPSSESFAAEQKAIQKEIRAHEEQARKIAIAIEQKQQAFLERGHAYFAGVLSDCREQAVSLLVEARGALGKLGLAPCQPPIIGTPGEYLAACESYDQACAAHDQDVQRTSKRIHRQLRALWAQAVAARGECRNLGLTCPEGVGYVDEYVRNNTRYSDAAHKFGEGMAYESVVYDVATVERLIAALTEPMPDHQAPNPIYPAGVGRKPERTGNWVQQGWARISQALAEEQPQRQLENVREAERVMSRSPEEQRLAAERQMGIRP